MKSLSHIVFPAFIVGGLLFSMGLYGAAFYKGYNADLAIHVLMVEHFSVPQDLYYWGQNRLGSILPMIGSWFHFFKLSPIVAATTAQYVLLGGSFLFLQSLVKHRWLKLLLALLIFFPHSAFQVQVLLGHPYIGHLFFLSLFIFLWDRPQLHYGWRLCGLVLTATGMVWSSEIALANLLAFALVYARPALHLLSAPKNWAWIAASVGAGAAFLWIAKDTAMADERYDQFLASTPEIMDALISLKKDLLTSATFATNKPPNHWLLYFIIILAALFPIRYRAMPAISQFLLISAVLSLLLIVLSKWAALMGHPLRYYTPAYLQLLLALLFYIDKGEVRHLYIPFAAICALSAYSGIYLISHFDHQVGERVNYSEARQIASMGNFGLIGSYWNTYSVGALSPSVDATPHHGTYVRNYGLVPAVFEHDSIMVIRNGFLETFPDTLQQFGHSLIKQGPQGNLNEFEWAFYQKAD